jgi:hypothetical protein
MLSIHQELTISLGLRSKTTTSVRGRRCSNNKMKTKKKKQQGEEPEKAKKMK